MRNLEKRIIAARGDGLISFLDDAWGRTEGFSPSECVLERSIAKSSTRVVMLIVAALSIAVCPVLIVSIEQGVPSSWLGRVIIGVLVLVCSVFCLGHCAGHSPADNSVGGRLLILPMLLDMPKRQRVCGLKSGKMLKTLNLGLLVP